MYSSIINNLPDNPFMKSGSVYIGQLSLWKKTDGLQCGLASTLEVEHTHTGVPTIPDPGHLTSLPALELADWIHSDIPLRRSVGCAAINALIPQEAIPLGGSECG